jgi:hypothetical protein
MMSFRQNLRATLKEYTDEVLDLTAHEAAWRRAYDQYGAESVLAAFRKWAARGHDWAKLRSITSAFLKVLPDYIESAEIEVKQAARARQWDAEFEAAALRGIAAEKARLAADLAALEEQEAWAAEHADAI